MVATLIYGPSISEDAGSAVFAVGRDPDTPHTWLAVDEFAKQFTDFPDAGLTDTEITQSSDSVEKVIECPIK